MNNTSLEKRLLEKPLYTPVVPENNEPTPSSLSNSPLLSFCLGLSIVSIAYCVSNGLEYLECRDYIKYRISNPNSVEKEREYFYKEENNEYRVGEFMFNLTSLGRKLALSAK